MKKWVSIGIVALGVVGIVYIIWQHNMPTFLGNNVAVPDTPIIEPNPWQVYKKISIDDTSYIYEVTWDQKYGQTKTAYCMVVFRNDRVRQYKLVAPWMEDVIIEYQNTNNIMIRKIKKQK